MTLLGFEHLVAVLVKKRGQGGKWRSFREMALTNRGTTVEYNLPVLTPDDCNRRPEFAALYR